MAETTKSGSQRAASGRGGGRASAAEVGEPTATGAVNGEERAGTEAGRERTARVRLPFVTAEFRAPHLHMPGRGEVDAVARGARSLLPGPKAALYYGALAVTAAVGVIEWPVAAAIGVGAALASRGEANPQPSGRMSGAGEQSGERSTADA
jgi:hypothetical protein